MLLSSTLKGRVIKFDSPAVDPNALVVLSFRGTEAISRPYSFDLVLASARPDLDSSALLQASAFLGIKQAVPIRDGKAGIRTLRIHGTLSTFVQGEKNERWVVYRATLVPRLWRLSLNSGSRVFLDKTIPEIVGQILKENGVPHESRLTSRAYPRREYVCQYKESDLDFVSRLLEHEGIWYLFAQEDDGEKVILGDEPSVHSGAEETVYRQAADEGEGWFARETVYRFSARHNLVPTQVVLQDYNYRTPSLDLKTSSAVDAKGFGTSYQYGEHYKSLDEGKQLARVRAEELKCRERLFEGTGRVRSFRAGRGFVLQEHYRGDFNRRYVITEVRHEAEQEIQTGEVVQPIASYRNEFVAIADDVPFRPARVTPKPKIVGTIHAKVDAGGSGEYAEIDDQGRYKVQIPFDLSGRKDGTASRFLRMAQPYAGADFGMHFPLHKGTEVILTHVDGDPDRPIIAGAVPNPETGGPVTGGNASQCVIKTGGGNKIVFEDAGGGQRVKISTPHEDSYFQIGSPNAPVNGIGMGTAANFQSKIGIDSLVDVGKDHVVKIGKDIGHSIGGNWKDVVDGWKNVLVKGKLKETIQGKTSKLVIGGSLEVVFGGKIGVITPLKVEGVMGWAYSGIKGKKVELIGGDAFSTTNGNKFELLRGNKNGIVMGNQFDAISGKKYKIVKGSDGKLVNGDEEHIMNGLKLIAKTDAALRAGRELASRAPEVRQDAEKLLRVHCDSEVQLQGALMQVEADRMEERAKQKKTEADQFKVEALTTFCNNSLKIKKG